MLFTFAKSNPFPDIYHTNTNNNSGGQKLRALFLQKNTSLNQPKVQKFKIATTLEKLILLLPKI